MIHVCLLTCDRYDYTKKTMLSFLECNAVDRFLLWHCDDASTDPRIRRDAEIFGFERLVHTESRVGVTQMIRRTALRLNAMGAEWMLLLENDWETTQSFPWPVFERIVEMGDVYSMRLYGEFKERNRGRRCGRMHRGRFPPTSPGWVRHVEGGYEFDVGRIHWGNPPAVSRVSDVLWLHPPDVTTEKMAIRRSGRIEAKVARMVDNVVYHIGAARTPRFVK